MSPLKLILAAAAMTAASSASASTLLLINNGADQLQSFDTQTLALSTIGSLGTNVEFGDLAYNGSTLWLLGGRGNNNLYTVNTGTGAATLVGNHGIGDLFGLAYNSANNTLYATQFSGGSGVYTLDQLTGAATFLANSSPQIGGLTYRANTNQLVGTEDGPGGFYEINPVTGAKTLLDGGAGFINDSDLDYDASDNSYFVADYSGFIHRYDATTFSRTTLGNFGASFDGLVVFDGRLTPAVPEPASWALMIAGFGLVGSAMRRRKPSVSVSFA